MEKLIVRASALSNIMTMPRAKKDRETTLSETAKSWIKKKVIQDYLGAEFFSGSKQTEKGNLMESEGIKMLSELDYFDADVLQKNDKSELNDILSGTPDLVLQDSIIDIKCPWDASTFPWFTEDADKEVKKSGYDWQIKSYCYLFGKSHGQVVYCLTDTPQDLLTEWDNWDLHRFDHIESNKRITKSSVIKFTDADKELIQNRYEIANIYYLNLKKELECK